MSSCLWKWIRFAHKNNLKIHKVRSNKIKIPKAIEMCREMLPHTWKSIFGKNQRKLWNEMKRKNFSVLPLSPRSLVNVCEVLVFNAPHAIYHSQRLSLQKKRWIVKESRVWKKKKKIGLLWSFCKYQTKTFSPFSAGFRGWNGGFVGDFRHNSMSYSLFLKSL